MATKVLVIEDDPDMREIEKTALGCGGFEVLLATNGKEGLDKLAETRPCVILLDLMMPIMDGLTFLAECRKRQLAAGVPIVCVSAGGQEMVAHAMRLGARECIHKPADFEELCDRVAHYCRRPPAGPAGRGSGAPAER
jgi:DNA-binding response OmpR family regulator